MADTTPQNPLDVQLNEADLKTMIGHYQIQLEIAGRKLERLGGLYNQLNEAYNQSQQQITELQAKLDSPGFAEDFGAHTGKSIDARRFEVIEGEVLPTTDVPSDTLPTDGEAT